MPKLLVNSPTGAQELLDIGEGGSYFDPSRVLWDEREDGELPEITLGGMTRNGAELAFSQARMDEHTEATKPPVPRSVSRRQARRALLAAGLLASVQPAIDAVQDATQRAQMQIDWDDSQEFQRDHPTLIALASALGLDSAGVDALFIAAAAL
jgi:hypothetical protein